MRSSTCGQIEARRSAPAAGPLRSPVTSPRADMSAIGTTTSRSHSLVDGGCTTVTGRPPARKRATSSTGRTVADRPDALGRPLEQGVEPFEAERQVRAALGAGDRVHLVEDDRLDPGERLAGLAR